MRRSIFVIGIFFLFVISSIAPIVFNDAKATNKESIVENYSFDRCLYPENYDCYNSNEIPSSLNQPNQEFSNNENIGSETVTNTDSSPLSTDGLMNSDWPMCSHDTRHTGHSPYSTAGNLGEEKWWYKTE